MEPTTPVDPVLAPARAAEGMPADGPSPAAVARRRSWPRQAARWSFASVLLAVVLVLVAARWLLFEASGTAWLLPRLPVVQVTEPTGALLGERFGAKRLEAQWTADGPKLIVEDFLLDGAHWRVRPRPGAWGALSAERFQAARITIVAGKKAAEGRPELPPSLRAPLDLALAQVQVDELVLPGGLPPVRGLRGRLTAGADAGALHRIEDLRAEWSGIQLSGSGQIATERPYALKATLGAQAQTPRPWAARALASGTLERIAVDGALHGEAQRSGAAAPQLAVRGEVLPFNPWPLGTLDLSTQALDLSALAAAAPRTRLSGTATVRRAGPQAPFDADVALRNADAGPSSAGLLPVAALRAQLRADLQQRDVLHLNAVDAELAGQDGRPAGRVVARGQWRGGALTLDGRVDALQPQRVHASAPAMTVSGPVTLTLRGLPRLDGQPHAPGAADAQFALNADGTLKGQVDGAPLPIEAALTVEGSATRWHLPRFKAVAGAARAEGTATAVAQNDGRWAVRSSGRLSDFDPARWLPRQWPQAAKGPNAVQAEWTVDVLTPRSGPGSPSGWAAWGGTADVRIAPSQLNGVPLQGQLQLRQAGGTRLDADATMGSNRIQVQAQAPQGGKAGAAAGLQQIVAQIDAPALRELVPLWAWVPGAKAWAPTEGSLQAKLNAEGQGARWQLRSEGSARSVQAGPWKLGDLQWTGQIPNRADQPLALRATLNGLAQGSETWVHWADAQVTGSLRNHQFQADWTAPLRPPEIVERVLGLMPGPGTQAHMAGQGSFEGTPGGAGIWRGHFSPLRAGSWDGKTDPSLKPDEARHWLFAPTAHVAARFDAAGSLVEATLAKGEAQLVRDARLHWQDVVWRPGGWRADVTLDPVAIVPYLNRLPTDARFAGDLKLGAHAVVQADSRFTADVSVARHSGDLAVLDAGVARPLALTELALQLTARDGLWRLEPKVSGERLGILAGAVTVRSTPAARWPEADAPLGGAIQFAAPNLGLWANWLPAGWRLGGALATNMELSGRFGEPNYLGQLAANGVSVSNVLEGVDVRDGQARITLAGKVATVETLSARGGEGTVVINGRAEFGETPTAALVLQAERFRLLSRIDRQLVLSGNLGLTLESADRLRLSGDLRADSGLFDIGRTGAPTLDDDVVILGPDASPQALRPPPSPLMRQARVDVGVDFGENLRLRGRGLDTYLRGQLRIGNQAGRLTANGVVNSHQGSYVAYGQKMTIERGRVTFNGPIDQPSLDIQAVRPDLNEDVRVGVAITGQPGAPRVRLFSEPEMSDTDKLSWLVLGRSPEGLGRTDTALLQRAAMALLAGEGGSPSDSFLKNIGLDDFAVRQSSGDVRDTIVTVGKRISQRWYIGYERGMNATSGTWQLIYRIAQRFTLRAQAGSSNALDLIWSWRFNSARDLMRGKPNAPNRNLPAPVPRGDGSAAAGP